jgi:hypothetical protein
MQRSLQMARGIFEQPSRLAPGISIPLQYIEESEEPLSLNPIEEGEEGFILLKGGGSP